MCGSEVADQRLRLSFRFASTTAFLQEWIRSTISTFLSRKHKTFWYSVQLGTLGVGRTIFLVAFGDYSVVLMSECNHVISSVTELNGGLQRWTTAACLLSFQRRKWEISRSNHTTQKGILRTFIQYKKERLFKNKNRQQEQNALDEFVPLLQWLLQPHESWAAVLTSVIAISLTLHKLQHFFSISRCKCLMKISLWQITIRKEKAVWSVL